MTINLFQDPISSYRESDTDDDLDNEIAELERKLAAAKAKRCKHPRSRLEGDDSSSSSPEQPLLAPSLFHPPFFNP